MQVILEHDHFANNANQPNDAIKTVFPKFRLVRQASPRFVLVLDTFGSMSGERIDKLRKV